MSSPDLNSPEPATELLERSDELFQRSRELTLPHRGGDVVRVGEGFVETLAGEGADAGFG